MASLGPRTQMSSEFTDKTRSNQITGARSHLRLALFSSAFAVANGYPLRITIRPFDRDRPFKDGTGW